MSVSYNLAVISVAATFTHINYMLSFSRKIHVFVEVIIWLFLVAPGFELKTLGVLRRCSTT
jgi:hypothetical protein